LRCDRIWRNARLATVRSDLPGLGEVEHGLVASVGDRIIYAGPAAEAVSFDAVEAFDCEGRWITPGLIDCHTHLIHAGDRSAEFEARQKGQSYEEIAKAGGGILSTVAATRAASGADLEVQARRRLETLIAEGVTTIEIKSGYGLTLLDEVKQLRAARALGDRAHVVTTFLGAHVTPPEFAGRPDDYTDWLCKIGLPAVAASGLADAVDVFCETIAFNRDQTRRVLEAARRLGFPLKLHAEQRSNLGGATLAAEFGALSADHLEHLDADGVAAMARAGTIAVLLPGAYLFLRETKAPPVADLRSAGVPMALATDCNPGTSPLTSILAVMNLGALLFGMTVEECLLGVTRNAARALGLAGEIGSLRPGMRCDLAIWSIERPAELVARLGFNPLYSRIWRGR
jgi:imidazolonepropionase